MGGEFQWVGSFNEWGVSMSEEFQWVRSFNG